MTTSLPARPLLVEAMLLMVAADGVVADEEIAQLTRTIAEHPAFGGLSPDAIGDEFQRAFNALSDDGFEARLDALARGLESYKSRLLAFAFATGICFADGDIAEQELALLKAFQTVFLLRDTHVAEIFEALQSDEPIDSLIERLLEHHNTPLSRQEAFIETMLLMAAADGEIAEIEATQLAMTIAVQKEFDDLGEEGISEALSAALERVKFQGPKGRLSELRIALPTEEDRMRAVRFALTILIADGVIATGETECLESMVEAFELNPESVRAISAAAQG